MSEPEYAIVPPFPATVVVVKDGKRTFVQPERTSGSLATLVTIPESHIILQPINSDGTSVFKAGSTVPTKFVVCDASGNSVGPNTAFPNSSVVKSYIVAAASNGTVSGVDETQYSTTPDTYFRWDPTAQQWIFNQATGKSTNLTSTGVTYLFQITLIDGTVISGVNNFNMVGYQYGLK